MSNEKITSMELAKRPRRSRKRKKKKLSFLDKIFQSKKQKVKGRSRRKKSFLSTFNKKFTKPKVKGRSRRRVKSKKYATLKILASTLVLLVSKPQCRIFAGATEYFTLVENDDKIQNNDLLHMVGPGYATSNNAVREEENVIEQPIGPGYLMSNVEASIEEQEDVVVQLIGPAYSMSNNEVVEKEEVLVQPIGPGYATPNNAVREEENVIGQPIGPAYSMSNNEVVEKEEVFIQPIGPGYATANNAVREENYENQMNDVNYMREVVINYCKFDSADYQTFISLAVQHLKETGVESADERMILEIMYDLSNVSIEEKVEYILNKYHLTYDELQFTAAVFMAEGKWESYLDVFSATDTGKNRCNDIAYYQSYGESIYSQVNAKRQFSVIRDKRVYEFLGRTDLLNYQAAIDSLYSPLRLHDYVEFRGAEVKRFNGTRFTPRGNQYGGRKLKPRVAEDITVWDKYLSPELQSQEVGYTRTLVP